MHTEFRQARDDLYRLIDLKNVETMKVIVQVVTGYCIENQGDLSPRDI